MGQVKKKLEMLFFKGEGRKLGYLYTSSSRILSKYVKNNSHYLLVQDANTISLYYDHDFAKALEIGNPEYISSLSC